MQTTLSLDGAVAHPLSLAFDDLVSFGDAGQIADVSRRIPSRSGGGVCLNALLDAAHPLPGASLVTLHAADGFRVSAPIGPLRDAAIVVYRKEDRALKQEEGGPFRLVVPDGEVGGPPGLDECLNVKYLERIELKIR